MKHCSKRGSKPTWARLSLLLLALASHMAGARQASTPAATKAPDGDSVYVTARLYPNAEAQAAAEARAKAAGKPGAKAARQADPAAAADSPNAAAAKPAAASAASAASPASAGSSASAASKPKPGAPPRRAVRQDIAVMPAAPRAVPSDTYRPGPSPTAPAVVLAAPAPVQVVGCDGGGCNGANGARYNGNGAAVVDPQGRQCIRNGTSVQCF